MDTVQSLNRSAWDQMLQNPRRALELSQKALEAQTGEENAETIETWHNLGWSHFYLSQQTEALGCFTNALDLCERLGTPEQETRIHVGLGAVYQQLSRYEPALEHLTAAFQLAGEAKDSEGELRAGVRIGEVHLALGKPTEALHYFLQAQNLAKKSGQKDALADIQLSLGQTYLALKRNDEALEQLSRALVLTKELNNKIGEARALTHIGLIYRDISELEISEEYHLECLKICQAVDHKWGQLEAYYNLGDLHQLLGHKDVAKRHYEKVIALSVLLDSKFYLSRTYQKLADFWEKEGDFKKSLEYTRQAMSLERDLGASDAAQKVRSLNTQFEFERNRSQAEILRLKSERLQRQSDDLQQTLESLSVISELGRIITSSLKSTQLVQTIWESLDRLVESPVFGLGIYNQKRKVLKFPFLIENGRKITDIQEGFPLERALGEGALASHATLLIDDIGRQADELLPIRFPHILDFNGRRPMKSMMFLPLTARNELLGVVTVQHPDAAYFTESHQRVLEALGGFITVALRNMLNHRKAGKLNQALRKEKADLQRANMKIQHMAHHDLLTGLANRRLLTNFMSKTIPYCQRHNRNFALYFLDLNGFKPVNDNYGHDAGDWTLARLGERLGSALRDSDLVARVGGDEFVALALEINGKEQAARVAEKIQEVIHHPLDWNGNELKLGVSIGISLFPQDGQDVETLLNKADDAMYQVKRQHLSGWCFADSDTIER